MTTQNNDLDALISIGESKKSMKEMLKMAVEKKCKIIGGSGPEILIGLGDYTLRFDHRYNGTERDIEYYKDGIKCHIHSYYRNMCKELYYTMDYRGTVFIKSTYDKNFLSKEEYINNGTKVVSTYYPYQIRFENNKYGKLVRSTSTQNSKREIDDIKSPFDLTDFPEELKHIAPEIYRYYLAGDIKYEYNLKEAVREGDIKKILRMIETNRHDQWPIRCGVIKFTGCTTIDNMLTAWIPTSISLDDKTEVAMPIEMSYLIQFLKCPREKLCNYLGEFTYWENTEIDCSTWYSTTYKKMFHELEYLTKTELVYLVIEQENCGIPKRSKEEKECGNKNLFQLIKMYSIEEVKEALKDCKGV